MPTRILFVHGISEIGGAETELLNILKSLDSKNFIPMVAFPAHGPLAEELGKIHVPFYSVTIPPWRKVKHCWKIPIAIFQLVRLLKLHRIDVLHVNDYWWGPLAWLAARLRGIPCVVHIRQQVEPYRVRQYWMKRYDKILAVSESIRQVIVQNGVDPQRVEVLYSGIDCQMVKPRCGEAVRTRNGLKIDQPVVGVVANLFERKGLEYLLNAMAIVRQHFPNVHCFIVGEGDPCYRQKLEGIIQEKNLEQSVTLAGFQHDVFEFLASFDIFVLPSILEGFGIVLLEAMAMGKPVIATGVGGTSEIVDNGKSGLLVSPRSADSLAGAVVQLLQSPKLREEMGKAGRKRVETHFNFSRTMDNFEAVYRSLSHNSKEE